MSRAKAGAHVRIRDTDRGYARLMRQLESALVRRLSVGLHPDAASMRQEGSDSSLLTIALAHEFGTSTVPERSFIRAWADENHAKNLARIRRVARTILKHPESEERLLRELGKEMADEIQARISRGISPALKPESARQKGSNTPLEGGQLVKAIRAEFASTKGR